MCSSRVVAGAGRAAALAVALGALMVPRAVVARPAPSCERDLLAEGLARSTDALDQRLQSGVVGDHLVEQFSRAACRVDDAARWLPRTCGATRARGRDISELRRALIHDALHTPAAAVAGGMTVPSEVVALAGIVEAAGRVDSVGRLAWVLGAQTRASCVDGLDDLRRGAQERAAVSELARVAALLDAAVGAVDERVDAVRRIAGDSVPAGSLERLFEAVDAARALEADPASLESWLRSATALTAVVVAAAQVLDVDVERHARVGAMLEVARSEENIASAATAVVGMLAPLPADVRFALERGLSLVQARDVDEAKRIVRRFFLPMWDERFLFDLNAGIPRLASGRIRFAGDALFGYQGKRWGVAARGGVGWYDTVNDSVISETIRGGGDLEGWWVSSGERSTRFEIRGEAAGGVFDTSTIDLTGTQESVLAEETSAVVRGQALLGIRYEPRARVAALFSAGAGGQYENYYAVDVAQSGDGFGTSDNDTGSVTAEARLRLQYQLVPRWLVGRTRVDASYYRLSRVQRSLFAGMGMVDIDEGRRVGHQVELISRLFFDLEALRFAGFVPGAHAGLDLFYLSLPDEASRVAPVWVFGAGVRRVAF